MAFAWVGKKLGGLKELEAYLNSLSDAQLAWIFGVTLHHTWSPTLPDWHASGGEAQMKSLAHYYEFLVQNKDGTRGWPAGPHLFIADDAIWLGTPFTTLGVHAGWCNSHYLGFEIVGDYDKHYWSPQTEYFVLGAVTAVFRRRKLKLVTEDTLRGHRDCASPKTCPGAAIALGPVRDKVRESLGMTTPAAPEVPEHHMVIGVQQSATKDQCQKYLIKYGVNLLQPEVDFLYSMAQRLEVDFSFIIACWKQESFDDDITTPEIRSVIGGGELQRQTRNPLNIKSFLQDTRDKVLYKGQYWEQWENWQLGLIRSISYMKQEHGAHGRLTVEDIIPVHAPAKDNPKLPPAVYINNVLIRMKEMQSL